MQYLAHHLNSNIHELTIWESSRRACQYLLNLLAQNFQTADSSELYLLVDMRPSGLLPLSYLNHELQTLLANHPQHAKTHLAMVVEKPELMKMVQGLLRCVLRSEVVQYFTDVDSARDWLANN